MAEIVEVKTSEGSFFVDKESDRAIYRHLSSDGHQEGSLEIMRHLISPESTIVDIGAHIGTLTIPLSSVAKNVIAFEPSRVSFDLLAKNIALNHRTNVKAVNKGLGRSNSRAESTLLRETNSGSMSLKENPHGEIEIATLDSFVDHADLIKIDVEGMEPEVLEGGRKLINKSKPAIFVEINASALRKQSHSVSEIRRFFRNVSYEIYAEIPGSHAVAPVISLFLLAFLISPGSYLFRRESVAFDILALPKNSFPNSLKKASALKLILAFIRLNTADKIRRIRRLAIFKYLL